ncbi:MAG TPA: ROK family transcriptional regulator [Virgibacillus sp.]|nr:ROK family transcriptional regulator [Virgibacillus sp.]
MTFDFGNEAISVKKPSHVLILNEIRKHSSITKADLVEKFDLTSAAIGKIVSELISSNIVQEIGYGMSQGGRPPVLYAMHWESAFVIAIDIGVKTVSVAAIDLKGEAKEKISAPVKNNSVIQLVYDLVDTLLDQVTLNAVGIGVSAPGPINPVSGTILTPPNLSGAKNLKITELLEIRYDLPTILEVDANASALAEQWFGSSKESVDTLFVYNDQGLGGSVIIDSRVYKGMGNSAGEIGHMSIDIDGPKCSCGNFGCLETLGSGMAIEQYIKAGIRRGAITPLESLYSAGEEIALSEIAKHAYQGDSLAKQAFEEAGRYLGIGVANAVNLFAPDLVVFGGHVSALYPKMIQIAERVAKKRSFSPMANNIPFARAEFNKDSNLIGAAAVIQQKIFDYPEGILM